MHDRLAGFSRKQRRRDRLARKVAASALAVAVVGAAAWWQLTPNTFHDAADFGLQAPESVRQSVFALAPLSASREGESPTVHFERVTATTSVNTAAATVTVFECHLADPSTQIVSTQNPADCATLTPLTTGDYTLGRAGVEVLFEITPRRAGVVHISGLDVSYWDGIQRGRQHITANEQFTFR